MKSELPEGDIGQLLRGLKPQKRKSRNEKPAGGLAARVGSGGRIARRRAAPRRPRVPTGPRIPTSPRDSSTTRTWSSRGQSRSSQFVPDTERRFDTDVYGMRAVDDMVSGLRRLENDPDSVILAIHGATRSGPGGLRSGYGVFVSGFAEGMNCRGLSPNCSAQTADFAEILGALEAMKIVHTLTFSNQSISHVVIKTTSEYLVNGMAELVWIWAGREYNNCRGNVCILFACIFCSLSSSPSEILSMGRHCPEHCRNRTIKLTSTRSQYQMENRSSICMRKYHCWKSSMGSESRSAKWRRSSTSQQLNWPKRP